ncbi:MAG: PKD repeat protein [Saprospiraceae bacterium]|jgi:PKD repeat protein
MKNIILTTCIAICTIFSSFSQAGGLLCVDINNINPDGYDVFSSYPDYDPAQVKILGMPSNCYYIEEGKLFINNNPDCCREYEIEFMVSDSSPIYLLELIIKCPEPKPNCTTINLSEYELDLGAPKPIIYACDQSPITYLVDDAPGQTIIWNAGAVPVNQGPNNQAVIIWPDAGSYSLTVTVGGSSTTYCIEILDSPVADFVISGGGSGCLNTSIDFMSTSIGGNEFYWDFGDGQFGTGATTSNTYTTPGVYNITLVVIQDNYDQQGQPLCCCSDTITMPITISPLPGPEIFWISTLCEGDTTKYWTTAADCIYTWTAKDADGITVLPVGTDITNDTLCVVWGDGPFGTVTVAVSGCSDGPYCTDPTSVIIPIIESDTEIMGKDTVCEFTSEFYDVQKWPTTTYTWSIDPVSAGFIASGQGTNAVSINWLDGPQYATVNVTYGSEFLGGIFGHTEEDCQGSGSFEVHILPKFELIQPTEFKFCLDEDFTLEAGDIIPSITTPVNGWTWEIRPTVGATIISTGNITPYTTSLGPAGFYTIAGYPDYPNPFCNDTVFTVIEIIEVPLPDSITGEKFICASDTETYFGHTSSVGTQLDWDVIGGSFAGSSMGNPVTINWDPTGPYLLSLRQIQTSEPECASDYITCMVELKTITPVTDILGSDGCTNDISSYTASPLPIDPEVSYSWDIAPIGVGSVVGGLDATTCDIQWNNTAGSVTITFSQTLCGITTDFDEIFNLNEAAAVTISQNIDFCVGVAGVVLTASTPLASYIWDVPSGPNLSGQSITISEGGNYVITVTESNNCTAVANYFVNEIDGPNTNLSSPDILDLCTSNAPEMVTLHALAGGWTSIEWWKKTGVGPYILQPLPVNPLEYIHTNSGVVGTCTYYYIVTNASGCKSTSNTIVVDQSLCTGGGGNGIPCNPVNHTVGFTYTPSTNCNEVTFMPANSANVTITGWDFNDPILISPTGPGPMFSYSFAGYYLAYMYYSVPDQNGGSPCELFDTTSVCIPMVADFSITDLGCGLYEVTNTSSYVDGMAPTTFDWVFEDAVPGTGTGMMTTVDFMLLTGMKDITLTITNPAGCESQVTKSVNLAPPPMANIVVMPPDTCVTKPFSFSNLDDTGIIAWDWDFNDLTGNGGSNPEHSYLMDGMYTVTLTVTNENGCTGTDEVTVTVHPAPVEGPITYGDDLFLCVGEALTLFGPAGDTYLWSEGSTTPSITVMTAGIFGVTVSDVFGCSFVPDSVEVIVFPEIDATIQGNNIICDEGCTTLFAVDIAGYMYDWTDQSNNVLPANTPPNSVTICFGAGITDVMLTITDDNGCDASSSINIEYFDSPDVNITASDPSLCAGTPNTLTAITIYPDPVTYKWSTGATSTSIVVGLEGTYYVTVTDPVTGCSDVAFVVINPLPDLCVVPAGCYTACDPDTLCATPGLVGYEWYYNGTIDPTYSGMECIIVSESGTYNFEGTNEFGCTDISEPLILEMVPCCREGDTEITAIQSADLSCCYTFSYSLTQDIFYSLDLYSDDAGLDIDVGTVDPSLTVTSTIPALNSFENVTSGDPLPQGPITSFITICLEDVIANPVILLADWRGEDGSVLCTDTLELMCTVEPDCVYVLEDSLYCGPNGQLLYDLTICNPADAEYSVGYLDFIEFDPVSAMFLPSEIDITGSPLLPGECRDFTISIIGSGIANDSLKFKLVGHENDPNEDPGTLCCSIDELYCTFIPGCTLCDMVYISSIDTSDLGDCCYDITVNNYFDVNYFSGIQLCVLTPSATFDIVNPLGSPWDLTGLSDTNAMLDYNSAGVSHIPLGDTDLPTICIANSDTPIVDIEIKWINGSLIECRDTISLLCEGDCGYMSDATLICGEDGTWVLTGSITNTSDYPMTSAFIDLGVDILDPYDMNIDLGTLEPGGTYGPFSFVIDIPNISLEELCVIITLHSEGHSEAHEDCCQFKTILPIPVDCGQSVSCECGPAFENMVELGMTCQVGANDLIYTFAPIGNFGDCDKVIWNWVKEQTSNMTVGSASITHTFPAFGEYIVCMTIIRTQANGKQCKMEVCKDINVFPNGFIQTYPNPVTNELFIGIEYMEVEQMANIQLIDANNRVLYKSQQMVSDQIVPSIDVTVFHTGVYTLRITIDDNVTSKKVLIVH